LTVSPAASPIVAIAAAALGGAAIVATLGLVWHANRVDPCQSLRQQERRLRSTIAACARRDRPSSS
jgi:hypothetical protein